MLKNLALFFIKTYRFLFSPILPRACRFYPSCSVYSEKAIEAHGALKGILLAAGRILRCHPLNPGGYDPVPMYGVSRLPAAAMFHVKHAEVGETRGNKWT